MFKTFLTQIYASALWTSYKISSYIKVKVSHNDIFRSLFHAPRYESASTQFAAHAVRNLGAVLRSSYYSLMCRVTNSMNMIVQALVTSEARLSSRIWHTWGIALGRDMAEVF